MKSSNRIYYIDVLKIISCFAVVFLHVSAQNFEDFMPDTFEWQVFNFYDSCVRFAVPVFVMVSGALFLDKNREKIDLKKLYTKNIVRLLTAYLFYTIFYAAFDFYLENGTLDIKTIVKNALLNSNYHLWFIPMLIGIYVLVPLLQKITANSSQDEIKYIILLFFLFNILKNTIKPFSYPYSQYINAIMNRFSIDLLSGYIGYFLLGYYLNTYEMQKKNRFILYGTGVISVIICIVGNSLYSLELKKPEQYFYDNFFITTFFTSAALFVLVQYAMSNVKIKNRTGKIMINLSEASFGIYLIHVAVICLFTLKLNFYTTTCNPIFAIPIISIGVFILSFILINVIKKIPYVSKYIT